MLDRVPGEDKIFIGGIFTLQRRTALQQAGITHVLSVVKLSEDKHLLEPYQHMEVPINDMANENILEHFPAANRFIETALDSGGTVLVHCAMGKSRSAACVMAYLMHKYRISAEEALSQIREGRPMCEPNEGFMAQLKLYHSMEMPSDLEQEPAYQRWMYQRAVRDSGAGGQAPLLDGVRFRDEGKTADEERADYDLRCRKCRRVLATSTYVHPHTPLRIVDDQSGNELQRQQPDLCAHVFLDPLSWMRPELDQGNLNGRLECPKCKTNVGKYAWQGMRCSCSMWVVPGISLARGRVDQAKSGDVAGIRQPPPLSSH